MIASILYFRSRNQLVGSLNSFSNLLITKCIYFTFVFTWQKQYLTLFKNCIWLSRSFQHQFLFSFCCLPVSPRKRFLKASSRPKERSFICLILSFVSAISLLTLSFEKDQMNIPELQKWRCFFLRRSISSVFPEKATSVSLCSSYQKEIAPFPAVLQMPWHCQFLAQGMYRYFWGSAGFRFVARPLYLSNVASLKSSSAFLVSLILLANGSKSGR